VAFSKTKTCCPKFPFIGECRLNGPARLQTSLARFGAGITGAIELIALRRALPQGADQTAPAAPIAINILS
jgi:hypothetical protein